MLNIRGIKTLNKRDVMDGKKTIDPNDAREFLNRVERYKTLSEAAREMNLARTTLYDRVKSCKLILKKTEYIPPVVSDPELPVEELIEKVCDAFQRRHKSHKEKQWMPFSFNSDKPICLAFVGDPHVDDNGCNWPLLKEHIDIIRETDGMYGVGLGDYTNNWHGYLNSKVSRTQEVTSKQAWKLATYLIKNTSWLLLIKGNHDLWSSQNSTGDPLDWVCEGEILQDWQAKFSVNFPNGKEVRIHAAHDFKGHSMWNSNHGPMKAEQMSGTAADIYVAGDKHNWIITRYENATTGKCPVIIRARGYKYIDSYSEQLGYPPQQYGATICVVIDPSQEGPQATKTFECPKEAASYLNYLRQKK